MSKFIFCLFNALLIATALNAQIIDGFEMQITDPDRSGLVGNGITDLVS